jgi:hypothetical protein
LLLGVWDAGLQGPMCQEKVAMFVTNADRLIAHRLASRRRRTLGETARFIANCRGGRPLSSTELYQLARQMILNARRQKDEDRDDDDDDDDDDDFEDNQGGGSDKPAKMPKARLAKDYVPPVTSQKRRKRDDDDDEDDDEDDDTDNRRTRNSRHLPPPTMNFTYERRVQSLMDRGMNMQDAALVAAADFHSFDMGPGRMTGGGMHSMDTQYLEAPPPASFPREAQYGKDGRGVKPLTRTPPGLPDADEDDHSVESMMKFAARTGDLPLPNTVQKLVAEAGNRRAAEEKQARETH